MEARRQHSRDALACGVALVDDRLSQRSLPGSTADDIELVLGQQTRGGKQVGYELCSRVDALEGRRRRAAVFGRLVALLTGRAEVRTVWIHASIPQTRYRLNQRKCLATFPLKLVKSA